MLPDGRRLSHTVFGDPRGFPVLALHGTPGSRLKFAMAGNSAAALGLRLIAVDRWGYGASDRPAAPTLSRFAQDMERLLDGMGVGRTAILGISGGGPFAAASAAHLGARVGALALVAPVGLVADAPERGGMTLFHTFCFRVLPRLPGVVRAVFAAFRMGLAFAPVAAVRLIAARAGSSDRALLAVPGTRDHLARCFQVGLARGGDGPVVDMAVFANSWGIDLGRIGSPSRLWLGDMDRNVPLAAAGYLATAILRCEINALPGHGHFWITRHFGDVLSWIAGHR